MAPTRSEVGFSNGRVTCEISERFRPQSEVRGQSEASRRLLGLMLTPFLDFSFHLGHSRRAVPSAPPVLRVAVDRFDASTL